MIMTVPYYNSHCGLWSLPVGAVLTHGTGVVEGTLRVQVRKCKVSTHNIENLTAPYSGTSDPYNTFPNHLQNRGP